MGNSAPTYTYSVEIPGQAKPEGCTTTRRNPKYVNQYLQHPQPNLKTIQDCLMNSFKKFPQNPCIGTIVSQNANGTNARRVVSKNYAELQVIAEAVGKNLVHKEFCPLNEEVPEFPLRFAGIYAKNRSEWFQANTACVLYGITVIPIYDTLGLDNISHVLEETHLTTMFGGKESLDTLLKLKNLHKLKNFISFDAISAEAKNNASTAGLAIYDYVAFMEEGKNINVQPPTLKPESVISFCYTSGTTGPPKGAILTHQNFVAVIAELIERPKVELTSSDIYLSYLPLPHVMESLFMYSMLYAGAHIVCFGGDVQKLKDDLALVKPTVFSSVPRLYNRFYEAIHKKFGEATGIKKCLIDKAVASKSSNISTNGDYEHSLYDKIVFSQTKEALGGRVRIMASGSAPLLPHVKNFMEMIACCPLIEGYGQTQSTGGNFTTLAHDIEGGHVGGPLSAVEFKLQDIPEMRYRSTDPNPRGQICIRGPVVFRGYYKNPAKTKEALDSQGWLHTGDVGELLPSGAVKIIDRKKNIFKLQQGEYVAPEKVEAAFVETEQINQMFVYGDSTQNFAVAVIVPKEEVIQEIAKKNGMEGRDIPSLYQDKTIRKEYLNKLNAATKKLGLSSFEQPKNVYLEQQTFVEKKILTNTMKLQRFEAKEVYKSQIAAMYAEGML